MKTIRLITILTALLAFSSVSQADPITFMKVGGVYALQYSQGGMQTKIRVQAIDGQWIQAVVTGGQMYWINMGLVLNVVDLTNSR
jgi:hypothetical protein